MSSDKHMIFVVGAGSGTTDLLTPEARRVIDSARCVAGGRGLLKLAPEGAELHAIGGCLDDTKKFIAGKIGESDVVVLASGDPGCFSILPFLKQHFPEQIRVLPGISSVQMMAARLELPWQDWELVSLHGRGGEAATSGGLTPWRPVLYFCDADNSPQAVARRLLTNKADLTAVVGTDLGQNGEQLWRGSLSGAAEAEFPGNSLLLVLPDVVAEKSGNLFMAAAPGIPDELWIRKDGIPMSKSEFRAVLMAKAQPAMRQVIWDVGAGTGSYAVECSLLAPRARVFAIDKNPEACGLIRENSARFGAAVETVCGAAPECFDRLPSPDMVIIGGNDGRLDEIFDKVMGCINPGGRVAATAVLDETRKTAHKLFAASGLKNRQATRVAIAHGEGHEWAENNPVIVFVGDADDVEK